MKHPEFAKRFIAAVSAAGVSTTQKSLSKLFGVSEVMIWSYRNGEKLPRVSTALRIAEKLSVSVVWLLQGDQHITTPPLIENHAINDSSSATYETTTLPKMVENIVTFCEKLSEQEQKTALALLKQKFPQQ